MAKRKQDDDKPKPVGTYCSHCQSLTSFFLFSGDEYDRGEEIGVYHWARCERCRGPAVFIRDGTDEEPDARLVKVYPTHRSSLSFPLPHTARVSYDEALLCEEAEAWLSCVVMVGRTLEAVCKEHFPKEKHITIFTGIDRLFQEGVISEQLKAWADELRILRNVGAHATQVEVSALDAREAIDFLKAILENLYDLSPKFAAFKSRRNNKQED